MNRRQFQDTKQARILHGNDGRIYSPINTIVSERHDPRPDRGCCHDTEVKIVNLHGELNSNMYVVPSGVEIITLVNSGDPIVLNINLVTYFEDFLKNKGPLFVGNTRNLTQSGIELERLLNFEISILHENPSKIQIRRNLPGDVINNQIFKSVGDYCDDEIFILTPVTKRLGTNTDHIQGVQGINEGLLKNLYPSDSYLAPEDRIHTNRKNCSITCLNGKNFDVVDVACKPDTPDLPITISQHITYNFTNGRKGQIVPYPNIDFESADQQYKTLSNFITNREEIYYYVKYDDEDKEYAYLPASSIEVAYNLDSLVNKNGKGTYILLACRGNSTYERELGYKELQNPKNQVWGGAQIKNKLALQGFVRNSSNFNTDNRIHGPVHTLRENLRFHNLLGGEYTKVDKKTMLFLDGGYLEFGSEAAAAAKPPQ